jgi:HEAT repeat protein
MKNRIINKIVKLVTLVVLLASTSCFHPVTAQQMQPSQVAVTQSENLPAQSTETTNSAAVSNKDKSPWLWEVNYFGKSFVLVNALIAVIFISIGVMMILLVLILLNRARLEREARLHQYLLEQYQTLILDYLFGAGDVNSFKAIASDKYRRQVLIDQIIDVSINLKGDAGEKLLLLYNELQLTKDSLSKARSRKWHIKVKGFKELAFMNIKDANEEIYKSLQSKNEILRMEAQIALVRLSDQNPFEWLYFQVHPFSLWEQISLHSLLIQHEIPVPAFNQWLDSPNYTVVMFALRMIREYKQREDEDLIFEVLNHNNEEVRALAIEVCGDLQLVDSLKILKSRYKYESYANRLEIVKAMGKMPHESMLGFLKLVLDKEDDVQLQIEATKAINNMGEVGVTELTKLMKSEYKNYQIIIRHVLDRRIV